MSPVPAISTKSRSLIENLTREKYWTLQQQGLNKSLKELKEKKKILFNLACIDQQAYPTGWGRLTKQCLKQIKVLNIIFFCLEDFDCE